MRRFAHSHARSRVNPATPLFDAVYDDDADATLEREHRRDVDDLAPGTLRDELSGHRLRQEEHRLQIDGHDVVPVPLGEFEGLGAPDDAGIVDQDVDPAERGDAVGDDRRDVRCRRKIGFHIEVAATGRLDRCAGRRGIAAIDAHDVGAGLRKRKGHSQAEAGVAAGDDGGLSGEVE